MGVRTTGCHHIIRHQRHGRDVRFYQGVLGFPIVVTLQLPDPDPFPARFPATRRQPALFFRISEQTRSRSSSSRTSHSGDNSLRAPETTSRSVSRPRGAAAREEAAGGQRRQDQERSQPRFLHSLYFETRSTTSRSSSDLAASVRCRRAVPAGPEPVPAALAAIGSDTYQRHLMHFEPDGKGGEGERG